LGRVQTRKPNSKLRKSLIKIKLAPKGLFLCSYIRLFEILSLY
jgi:hypothetical protein